VDGGTSVGLYNLITWEVGYVAAVI